MKIIRYIFLPILFFIFFFFLYRHEAINYSSKYHFDERDWISRSFYFETFINRNFKSELWNNYKIDGDPRLASYIFGFSIYPDYLKVKKNKGNDYDMLSYLIDNNYYPKEYLSKSIIKKYDKYVPPEFINWSSRAASGKTPNELLKIYGPNFQKTINIIFKAEKISIFFLILSILVVYLITIISTNSILASIMTTFLYGLSFLVFEYGTIAYAEGILLFLINLSVLDLVIYFNSKNKIVKNLCVLFFPIIAALANQTKSNGLLLMIIYCFFIILKVVMQKNINILTVLKSMLLEILIPVLIFVFVYIITNPFLWFNPIRNTIFQYKWTLNISLNQQKEYPKYALFNGKDRIMCIYNSLFANRYGGGLKPYFLKNPLLSKIYTILIDAFFTIGIANLFYKLIKNRRLTGDGVLLIITLLFYIFLIFYLLIAWDRYLVHMVFFIFYITVQGLFFIFNKIYKKPLI